MLGQRQPRPWLLSVLLLLLCPSCAPSASKNDDQISLATPLASFVVDPHGNDDNDGTFDNPLRTLERAVELAQRSPGPRVSIFLREGVHRVSETVVIADRTVPLAIGSWPGESATLSGATPLVLHRDHRRNDLVEYRGSIPSELLGREAELSLQSMMASDVGTLIRARFPDQGFVEGAVSADLGIHQSSSLSATPLSNQLSAAALGCLSLHTGEAPMAEMIRRSAAIPASFDFDRAFIDIFVDDSWQNVFAPVRSLGVSLRTVDRRMLVECNAPGPGSRYFVENVPQALDGDREFFIDWGAGEVRLLARREASTVTVEVPMVATLIRIRNASNVAIRGLTFSDGLYGRFGGAQFAGIEVVRSTNIAVEDDQFHHLGVAVAAIRSPRVSISRNKISKLYAHGIAVFGDVNEARLQDVIVADNRLSRIGLVNKDARAIFLSRLERGSITRNTIQNVPRSAVTLTHSSDTRVELNVIRGAGLETADLGALHTGGFIPDQSATWERNYVFGVVGLNTLPNGQFVVSSSAHGFYADTGSNNQRVVGNLFAGPMTRDVVAGAFDNTITGNLLLGNNANAGTSAKVWTNIAEEHPGALTIQGNFMWSATVAPPADRTAIQPGIRMFYAEQDPRRVTISNQRSIAGRSLLQPECRVVQQYLDDVATSMPATFCRMAPVDLAYLGCNLTCAPRIQ